MDGRGNFSSLAPEIVMSNPGYWTGIVFYFLSIFFNATFVYVTSNGNIRNKSADNTLSFLCCVQICSVVNMAVKTTLLYDERTTIIQSNILRLFDTLEFMFTGIYISLLLVLNTTRFIVMRNICSVQNNNTRGHSSRFFLLVVSVVVLLLSSVHGIISILEIPVTSYKIMIYSLHTAVIGIPWVAFLILHAIMVIYTAIVIYSRRKRKRAVSMDTDERSNVVTNTRGPVLADKLLRQVATSLVLQSLFIAIPCTYITTTDLIYAYSKVGPSNDIFTCIIKSVVPFLNPIGLGFFLKQRREDIASMLAVKSMSNTRKTAVVENEYLGPGRRIHAICQRNLEDEAVPESLRCDINKNEMMHAEQPRLFVARTGESTFGYKICQDTWTCPNDTYVESDIDIESISGISDISSLYFNSCSNISALARKHLTRQQFSTEKPIQVINQSQQNITTLSLMKSPLQLL